MEKLKLTKKEDIKMDFKIEVPKRLRANEMPSTIRIEFFGGEYRYVPRKNTFGNNSSLTIEELEAIKQKLIELNSQVKPKTNNLNKLEENNGKKTY